MKYSKLSTTSTYIEVVSPSLKELLLLINFGVAQLPDYILLLIRIFIVKLTFFRDFECNVPEILYKIPIVRLQLVSFGKKLTQPWISGSRHLSLSALSSSSITNEDS
uniref:Uncharacterized protein n=1 Tax=Megaselia scalaris TaxID=36166 RepID=T1GZ02_MEGSC